MRKYSKDKNAVINFVNLKKIVVDSEDDKNELLEAFEYLHDFSVKDKNNNYVGLDSDNIAVNLLMHLYLNPELIEIENNKPENYIIEIANIEKVVLDILSSMIGFDLEENDKDKYLFADLGIDSFDYVDIFMKLEHIFDCAIADDEIQINSDITIDKFIDKFIETVYKNFKVESDRR